MSSHSKATWFSEGSRQKSEEQAGPDLPGALWESGESMCLGTPGSGQGQGEGESGRSSLEAFNLQLDSGSGCESESKPGMIQVEAPRPWGWSVGPHQSTPERKGAVDSMFRFATAYAAVVHMLTDPSVGALRRFRSAENSATEVATVLAPVEEDPSGRGAVGRSYAASLPASAAPPHVSASEEARTRGLRKRSVRRRMNISTSTHGTCGTSLLGPSSDDLGNLQAVRVITHRPVVPYWHKRRGEFSRIYQNIRNLQVPQNSKPLSLSQGGIMTNLTLSGSSLIGNWVLKELALSYTIL
ncbi:uncharacterized protein LOC131478557 [Ochotona princeps]|uniref:uncharacterized protein LOC131478557 n=1 Tax=Ochotona princeps TaxID=9978 RepID=UPI0027152903|nr:uncharacterized protein LOC131478557 [Ochotona princeps]